MFAAERSANVALERPSDWEVIPHPDAELVVAAPLAPEGITVTAPLSATRAAVSIHCLHPQRSTELQIQMDEQDALILAGPSRTELDAGHVERYESLVQLDFVGLAELAPVVASWLGLEIGRASCRERVF